MSKMTKSERITQLEQIAVDQAKAFKIMADRLSLIEVESKWIIHMTGIETPNLKQLDQSVFDGLDSKWKYAAVDLDGESWVYREQPKIDKGDDRWSASNTPPNSIGTGYDASNWRNSLIRRDTARKLTGSELCRAMLERGDKYVMCLVNNCGLYNTLQDEPSIVIHHCENGFYVRDSYYEYAMPVNNQGEPLTASEVGL